MFNVIYYFNDGIAEGVVSKGELTYTPDSVVYTNLDNVSDKIRQTKIIRIVPVTEVFGHWIHTNILETEKFFTERSAGCFFVDTFDIKNNPVRVYKYVNSVSVEYTIEIRL